MGNLIDVFIASITNHRVTQLLHDLTDELKKLTFPLARVPIYIYTSISKPHFSRQPNPEKGRVFKIRFFLHDFAAANARAESPKAPSPGQAKRHPGSKAC